MTIPVTLCQAVAAHELSFTEDQLSKLAAYCEQLWDWNSRLNLTRHTNYDAFVTRDLFDCRYLAELLQDNERVLDVGSGGGVPGVVLAILRPDVTITLAESTQKKAAALKSIVKELSLPVTVISDRGEEVLRRQMFDSITARAVAPLKKLVPLFHPQRKKFCRLLLVKGPKWRDELSSAEAAGLMDRVHAETVACYATPGRDGRSVVLEVTYQEGSVGTT